MSFSARVSASLSGRACGRMAFANAASTNASTRSVLATGQLAKTDRVDALVLAAFAKAIRPQARPLKDADTRALNDMVSRRRQLIAMRVQETLRLGTAASRPPSTILHN